MPRQDYMAEVKVQAPKHAQEVTTRELSLIERTLPCWVKAAEAGKLLGTSAKPVTAEQMGVT